MTIDTLDSGRFSVRVRIPGVGQRRAKGTFATRAEAEYKEACLLAAIKPQRDLQTALVTFGRAYYADRKAAKDLRDVDAQLAKWNLYVAKDPIARVDVRGIRRKHILSFVKRLRTYKSKRTGKVLGPRSVLKIVLQVSAVLGHAVDMGKLAANPAFKLKIKGTGRITRCDSWARLKGQVGLLCAAEPGFERCVIAFAMGTGLRPGELVALHLDDVHVDDENPHITVRYGSAHDGETKTEAGKRDVPLFGMALAAVRAWLPMLETYAPENKHGLLFPREGGGYRDQTHVLRWERWETIRAAAGRKSFRWYDLRHTCASSLVSGLWGRRWSLEEIRGLLGHTSVSTTAIYAHLCETALIRAANETDETRRDKGGQMPEQNANLVTFLKPRSAVRFGPGVPQNKPLHAIDGTPRVSHLSHRRALAAAVMARDEARAWALVQAMAESVLDSPRFKLATAILEGGPFAWALAADLADILDAEEAREAIAMGGAS
jgi:integrase